MKKIITSLLIFIFISLSFSAFVFADYNPRQLPWNLPEKLEGYEGHKYILILEEVKEDGTKNVYLLYSHLPFSFGIKNSFYLQYSYRQAETLVYKLINSVFVYQYTTSSYESFILMGHYFDDDDSVVYLEYNEWLIYRDRIYRGTYPIASNVNLDFAGNVWDKSNGLYDLPDPDLPSYDDDDIDEGFIVGGIVGGILNGLKSLFIPEKNIFQDIVAKFSDKFPIVGQVVDLFLNLYNIGENEPVFKFTYKDMELKIVDFSSFKDYLPLVRNLTGAFLFLSFITREIKLLPRIIRGRH